MGLVNNSTNNSKQLELQLEFNMVVSEMMENYTFSPELIKSIKMETYRLEDEQAGFVWGSSKNASLLNE